MPLPPPSSPSPAAAATARLSLPPSPLIVHSPTPNPAAARAPTAPFTDGWGETRRRWGGRGRWRRGKKGTAAVAPLRLRPNTSPPLSLRPSLLMADGEQSPSRGRRRI
ncbi:Os08g0481700 [Oryza sativa Japonica Group]|uniref:Os08g0481700 protein n=1 Tax=Oryza sativa subsp. japonica TaxID=39947 RepID=A0A0N7KQ12_ORYSJ|nr:hypothetical protein EE612_044952 [Oryza sativa]BAT05930.1 Os08g0481700 [Oryza sativa Japonica Group]